MNVPEIETQRLILRDWMDSDYLPFSEMNADIEVMEHFPKKLSREESDKMIKNCSEKLKADGFGFWATEIRETKEFIGFLALAKIPFDTFTEDNIEIGWRLKRSAWGKGYATEGARALLEFGFNKLNFVEIVSLTAKVNERSQKVMQRIGMTTNPKDDFDHPKVIWPAPFNLSQKIR